LLNRPFETWDHLLMVLGEMQVVFQEFLSLLREEERLLLAMNRQGVADITEKKEQVLATMCRYEQQVMAVMHQLAGLKNKESLGGWLKKSPQSQASSANTIFHELFGLTRKITEQGKKNQTLILRTQYVVGEAINLIYMGLGTGPVYQGSGALQFSSVPSSVNLQG
jgi:flagellar biosynthesis/type III secretory pathway chaperone